MDPFPCDECRAIYREFKETAAAIEERQSDQTSDPPDIATWVQQLDEEECARMRENSDIWKPWRRWQEHQALTGHFPSILQVPPTSMSNPN